MRVLAVPVPAMATDASLVTLNAALATFSVLSQGRSSMLGGWRFTLGEGVKGGLSGRIASDASRMTKNGPVGRAVFCHTPMQLAGATPDPRGCSPPRPPAEGRERGATRTRGRVRRGRPRAPAPLLLWVLQYVTTCPNISQHRRPRPRDGRPRPPRARSWACTRPPPRRREGRRGRGPGST